MQWNASSGLRLIAVMLALASLFSCQSTSKTTEAPRDTPQSAPVTPMPVQERPAASASAPEIPSAGVPDIRVAVLKDANGLKLSTASAEARVYNGAGVEIERIPANSSIPMVFNPGTMVVNGSTLNEPSLRIESASPGVMLRINDQDLATHVIIYRQAHGLTAVAQINLEEYLAGVLAGEVPFERWHAEALMAQAIVSRSFAYYQIKKNAAEAYDVESTVMSQVFKPGFRNNPTLASVVNATCGMVLTDGGKPFSAYFHSTCGDHTDPSSLVFPDRPAARPFVPVTCGFCSQSPAYRWKMSLDKHALEQKFAMNFSTNQHLAGIAFLDMNGAPIGPDAGAFHRAALVQIKRNDGTVFQMPANQFRLTAGPKDLKSMLFNQVTDRGTSIEFSGGGFGHGAGMCQWGSQGMALAGYTHLQILGKYYVGAALTRMY